MKVLLVAERESLRDAAARNLGPQRAEIIWYRNPIKAMDNLDEVEPQVVLFSAQDFPRHWKPFLALLRSTWDKSESIFILLNGDDFPKEEAAKAEALSVNGIVHENLEDARELNRLRNILSDYSELYEARGDRRAPVDASDHVELVMTHPVSLRLITGRVEDVSVSGLAFLADNPAVAESLERGTRFPGSTLRIGSAIYLVSTRVARPGRRLGLEFEEMPDAVRDRLEEVVRRLTTDTEAGDAVEESSEPALDIEDLEEIPELPPSPDSPDRSLQGEPIESRDG